MSEEKAIDLLINSYFNRDNELFINSLNKLIKNSQLKIKANKKFYEINKVYDSSSIKEEKDVSIREVPLVRKKWLSQSLKKGSNSLYLNPNIKEKVFELEKIYINRKSIQRKGLLVPNKVILVGDPGGGKTTLANKIISDVGANLITCNISQMISSALGETGKNIHKLFSKLRDGDALFLDEFDALATVRFHNSNDIGEMRRIVNVLLQEMDTLSDDILLIAATNYSRKIDPAILRRFSFEIYLPKPTKNERFKYINYFLERFYIKDNKKVIATVVNLTENYSYSELENLLNDYTINKLYKNKEENLLSYFVKNLQIRNQLNDTVMNKWLMEKKISITALSMILGISRYKLSDKLKKGSDKS